MRMVQGIRHPRDERGGSIKRKPAGGQASGKSRPWHRRVDQVARLALPIKVMDRNDIGMLELRRGARLAQKTMNRGWRFAVCRPQDLQRDNSIELGIAGAVDDSEIPAAKLVEECVLAK